MHQESFQKSLIILTGPTAAGKTKLSLSLAKAVKGEIVSADSMQVYKYMDIGTAKIKADEMDSVPHHLIDILDPSEEFNVAKFAEYAKNAISKIHDNGNIPIITGGTGFYIQAVLYDIDFSKEDGDKEYRKYLENIVNEKGVEVLYKLLCDIDKASAAAIHMNNTKRIIRALEYNKKTGELISEHNDIQRQRTSPYNYAYFVLTNDRSILYDTIDKRVDNMLSAGLLNEVDSLRNKGYHRKLISMQGLGYKELYSFLEGEISFDEAIRIIKRDTKHFAKRQLTWFKREKDVVWLDKSSYSKEDDILNDVINILLKKNIV